MSHKKIGLDIADNSIEVVELKSVSSSPKTKNKKQNNYTISKMNRIVLKSGIVERGRIKDKLKLAEALKSLLAKAKPEQIKSKDIIFALPESQVYTYIFNLDAHQKKDRLALIEDKVKKTIPLDFEEIFFSYQVVKENKNGLEIILVAANSRVILEWQNFFEEIGLKVDYFDIETLATFRGLLLDNVSPVCVVDIGSASSNITIFDQNNLKYIYSLGLAGNHWTNKLSQALKIDFDQAEIKKKKLKITSKTKASKVLALEVDFLIREIKKSLDYFYSKHKKKVTKIILLGGSSNLGFLIEYFNRFFKTEKIKVELGKANIKKLPAIEYIEAIGLALKGMDKKLYQNNLHFDLSEFKKFYKQKKIAFLKKQKLEIKEEEKQIQILNQIKSSSKSKLILLLVILFIGIILILMSWWYRKNQEDKQKKEIIKILETIPQEVPPLDDAIQNDLDTSSSKQVTTSSKNNNLNNTASSSEEIKEEKKYVSLNKKYGSWLNIRNGPGTDYDILGKIYLEEFYELLDTNTDASWYRIKKDDLGAGQEAWVFADYVLVSDNKQIIN